jgi:hypothetical protein
MREFKKEKRKRKYLQSGGKSGVNTKRGGAVGWGAGEMHVAHEDRRGTRGMESATDTDSRDNNHGDVRSQTALCTFHDSINI